MSLDRSLKGKSTLTRHRNVLRRGERVILLEDNDKWAEGKSSVFGIVKVAHRKQVQAKKAKAEVAADGTAPAAGAAPAPAAPAAKAGAPAAKAAPKK